MPRPEPGPSAPCELHIPREGCLFLERSCPLCTPWLFLSLKRHVYSSELHPPFTSFCTIYNSESFIFILAPPALTAAHGELPGFARLPGGSPSSCLLC